MKSSDIAVALREQPVRKGPTKANAGRDHTAYVMGSTEVVVIGRQMDEGVERVRIVCRGFRTGEGKDGRFCDGWVRSSDKDGRLLDYPHLGAEEGVPAALQGLEKAKPRKHKAVVLGTTGAASAAGAGEASPEATPPDPGPEFDRLLCKSLH